MSVYGALALRGVVDLFANSSNRQHAVCGGNLGSTFTTM